VKVDDCEFKLQVWDTMGQEKYRSVAKSFYRNAMGVFVVFDLTNVESFDNVRNWLYQAKKEAGENICKMIIANKKDLVEERQVSEEDIKELLEELEGIEIMEVSAKTGENINEAFMKIAKDIKKTFNLENKVSAPANQNIRLKRAEKEENMSGGCCLAKK